MIDQDEVDERAEFEVREVFAYYGRAAYSANCLEAGLTVALAYVELLAQTLGRARRERKRPTQEEWEATFEVYMAKHHGLSLGNLIKRFQSLRKISPELDALLREALVRRNYIAHGFFRESAVAFAHSAGRASMIEELDRDHDLFSRADEAVQAAVAPIIPKLGIDAEKQQAQIDDIIERELTAARTLTATAADGLRG